MNIEEIYTLYSQNYLVDTDTRKIRKNTLYFALKGANFNGNTFAEDALKMGANYSIVDESKYVTSPKIILVDNVLETLQKLASHHRKILNVPIISLTGSNGKTTTKELIFAVLATQFKTTATAGNFNNHIGVPLTLLSMTPETEIGIVEMGANHHKEIALLCSIANPDFGYITNFGKAHLEGFGSVAGVIEAKSEMYEHLSQHNKTVFVNTEDAIQVRKTATMSVIFFDESLEFLDANPKVRLKFKDEIICTDLIGNYNYSNIAAAITIGNFFNISTVHIKNALENYTSSNNRSQVIHTKNKNILILDAYNANPTSMKAAIDSFSKLQSKEKIVILGDMFELGKDSKEEHQKVADHCAELNFTKIFLVGELFAKTTSTHIKLNTFEALKQHIEHAPIMNSSILIKGSRGMALERCIAFL